MRNVILSVMVSLDGFFEGAGEGWEKAVNPVVLGGGTALFRERADRLNLQLLDTKTFRSGIVELRYAPAKGVQQ